MNLKAIRYESTSLNRIAADKSHRVIVALGHSVINLKSVSENLFVSCQILYRTFRVVSLSLMFKKTSTKKTTQISIFFGQIVAMNVRIIEDASRDCPAL